MVQFLHILQHTGIDRIRRGVKSVCLIKIRISRKPGSFLSGITAVTFRQVYMPECFQHLRKILPGLNRQKLIGMLIFLQIRILKPGSQPFIPAKKAEGRVGSVNFIRMVKARRRFREKALRPRRISGIFIIIDQA